MFVLLTLLAALARLLPHPANVTPIAALGLFAGAYGSRRAGWLLPLLALLAGDLISGLYHPLIMASVYGSFAIIWWIGRRCLRERRSPGRIGATAAAGSILFFTITNFACWLAGFYPATWRGLATCYVNGLPGLRNTLAGDLFYTAALFGGYALARRSARGAIEAQTIGRSS